MLSIICLEQLVIDDGNDNVVNVNNINKYRICYSVAGCQVKGVSKDSVLK